MSERSAVQNPMLRYAQEIGWDHVEPEQALILRSGEAGLYFWDVLVTQLLRLNPGAVDASRLPDILRRLNLLKPTLEGNREALSWLRGEQSVFVPEENRERNVRLIDFERLDLNIFQVTDEWVQKGTVFRNRADVVFLINGIPVALTETKAAEKADGRTRSRPGILRHHVCRNLLGVCVCHFDSATAQKRDGFRSGAENNNRIWAKGDVSMDKLTRITPLDTCSAD